MVDLGYLPLSFKDLVYILKSGFFGMCGIRTHVIYTVLSTRCSMKAVYFFLPIGIEQFCQM